MILILFYLLINNCKGKYNIGYDTKGAKVHFMLPKTIIIDCLTSQANGYVFNYYDFQHAPIYINRTCSGTLSSSSCGETFYQGNTYSSNCYMLKYLPNSCSTYDRVDYITSIHRESLLFLIVTEGYNQFIQNQVLLLENFVVMNLIIKFIMFQVSVQKLQKAGII